ncbi:MAG TPA: histidine phosphatase family protein [Stellaceae bacterium]|nr:histidine phosphatase family protein [Stellaceae bacterium]
MTLLALLRHGPTAWTREHRLQGRFDVPLHAAGRAMVGNWRLPSELRALRWLTSPLARCIETAALLDLDAEVEPRLIEMDWGRWEGRTVAELRAEPGGEMAAMEARGLDLQPPGGESPRAVQRRLAPLLSEIAAKGTPTGCVTHKGIIRAILALAAGWTMVDPEPARLDWAAVHVFRLAPGGAPSVVRLNRSLTTATMDARA